MDLARLRRRAAPAATEAGWLIPVVAALLSWPVGDVVPQPGLDPSWGAALHLAREGGLNWGSDVSFTYGPLGFLKNPVLWGTTTGTLALIWQAVLHFGVVAAMFLAARRSYGTAAAAVLAFLAGVIVREEVIVLAFVAGAILLLEGLPARIRVYAPLAGVVVAVEALAKPSSGLWAAGMLLLAGILVRREAGAPRALALYAGSAVAAALVISLAIGQSLGDLWTYGGQVRQLVSGYSTTMGLTDTARDIIELPAAGLLVLVGVVGARGRKALALLWLVACYYLFKEGFVRHDAHSLQFFGGVAGALLVMPRPTFSARLLGAVAVSISLAMCAYAGETDVGSLLDPGDHLSAASDDGSAIVSVSRRRRQEARGRAAMIGAYALPPPVLDALSEQSVHVYPTEVGVAWAYRLRWRPVPVFQSYTTYTEKLDVLDARRLASDSGPTRILGREESGVDGRLPAWDAPRTTLTMLCRYRPLASGGPWWVLERVPWRCGRPRRLATMSVASGQEFPVPPPPDEHSLVVMRPSGLKPRLLDRLRALAFRGPKTYVELDGLRHQLVAATADDGPLPISSREGSPLVPAAHTIAITRPGDQRLTITFEAIALRG